MDRLPKLRAVVRYGVGFDTVDIVEAEKRGILVCNTPDYGVDEVSDTAIAMIMNLTRRIGQYDYECRHYDSGWQENTIDGIKRTNELKLGVVGAGRIGGSVLLKGKALGFQTGFYDPYRPQGYNKLFNATCYESLEELLSECDVISVHVPLSDETQGFVNESFVSHMKPGACLVNTARGGLISELDIFYSPLKDKKLSGVALDVIPNEPPKDERLITAWRARESWIEGRFIINPHSAYYSNRAYEEMRQKAASNAKRIIDGKQAYNIIVDPT
jgi:D-3-phosphoglycerate dehydrogenase